MNRIYDIYIDLGSGYVLLPYNCIGSVSPININREKGEFYTRLELGEIQLKNTPEYKIYNLINNLDYTDEVKIKVEGYGLVIEGYFGRNDCKNVDNKKDKILKVTPAIIDNYRPYLENIEKETDLTALAIQTESITIEITEDRVSTISDWYNFNGYPYGDGTVSDNDWDAAGGKDGFINGDGSPNLILTDTAPFNITDRNGQTLANRIAILEEFGYELSGFTIWEGSSWWNFGTRQKFYITTEFSRDYVFSANVPNLPELSGGVPTPPDGDGWDNPIAEVFVSENGGQYGYNWVRKPFNGAYSDDWTEESELVNEGDGAGSAFYWRSNIKTSIKYPRAEGEEYPVINTFWDLKQTLTKVYQNLSDELATKEVLSTFFWNDNEASLPFMEGLTGSNYVTRDINILNGLKLLHTYTLKTNVQEGTQESEDSTLKTTFQKLIDELKMKFPIFVFMDNDQNLIIEHIKYVDLVNGSIDISSKDELIDTAEFDFDKSDMFDEIIFNQNNSGYVDFTGNKLTFEKILSNNRNKDLKLEETSEIITTDLRYCIENPNDLENGLILVAASDGVVLNQTGQISTTLQLNGWMAISRLLLDYWRYEGVWIDGKINDIDQVFEKTIRSRMGIELQFRGVINSLFYTSLLGVGLIEEGSLDLENGGITKIKLRHRLASSLVGDQVYLAYAEADEENEVYGIFDFENYET